MSAPGQADAQGHQPLLRFNLVVFGVVLWEILSTSPFEWRALHRRNPYKLTVLVHAVCRSAFFIGLLLLVAQQPLGRETVGPHCNAWLVGILCFSYLAEAVASSIFVFCAIAVWDRNVFLTTVFASLCLAPFALHIRTLIIVSSSELCSLAPYALPNAIAITLCNTAVVSLLLAGLPWHTEHRWQGKLSVAKHEYAEYSLLAVFASIVHLVLVAAEVPSYAREISPAIEAGAIGLCATRFARLRILRAEKLASSPNPASGISALRFRALSNPASVSAEWDEIPLESPYRCSSVTRSREGTGTMESNIAIVESIEGEEVEEARRDGEKRACLDE